MSLSDADLERRPLRKSAVRASAGWCATIALVASVLWPGVGHWIVGRRWRGLALAVPPALALAFLLWHASQLPGWGVTWLLRPGVLRDSMIGNLVLGGYRAVALLDLVRITLAERSRSGAGKRRPFSVLAALLVGAVIVPHGAAGLVLARWSHFLDTTFPAAAEGSIQPLPTAELPVGSRTSTFAPARTTPIEPTPPPVSTQTVLLPPNRELPPAQQRIASKPRAETPATVAAPQRAPTAIEPALADGRIVVLLVGTDAGPGRWSARADTIVIAALDVESGRGGLFGVPRNLVGLPIPRELADLYPDGSWPGLANALYTLGWQRAERFPHAVDPGAAALARSLEQLIGIPIDYTVVVDMGGFVRVVDALGGVTIDVPRPVSTWLSPPLPGEDWAYYEIPAGRQHLDGHEALAYARSRTGTSDYDRMQRQRCLLGALWRQADWPTVLFRLPQLLAAVEGAVRTDIPREALPQLVQLALGVRDEAIVTLGFTPPRYTAGWAPGGYPIPDRERIQNAIEDALAGTGEPEPETRLASSCSWSP